MKENLSCGANQGGVSIVCDTSYLTIEKRFLYICEALAFSETPGTSNACAVLSSIRRHLSVNISSSSVRCQLNTCMTSTSVRRQLKVHVSLISIRCQLNDVNVDMTSSQRRYYVRRCPH